LNKKITFEDMTYDEGYFVRPETEEEK